MTFSIHPCLPLIALRSDSKIKIIKEGEQVLEISHLYPSQVVHNQFLSWHVTENIFVFNAQDAVLVYEDLKLFKKLTVFGLSDLQHGPSNLLLIVRLHLLTQEILLWDYKNGPGPLKKLEIGMGSVRCCFGINTIYVCYKKDLCVWYNGLCKVKSLIEMPSQLLAFDGRLMLVFHDKIVDLCNVVASFSRKIENTFIHKSNLFVTINGSQYLVHENDTRRVDFLKTNSYYDQFYPLDNRYKNLKFDQLDQFEECFNVSFGSILHQSYCKYKYGSRIEIQEIKKYDPKLPLMPFEQLDELLDKLHRYSDELEEMPPEEELTECSTPNIPFPRLTSAVFDSFGRLGIIFYKFRHKEMEEGHPRSICMWNKIEMIKKNVYSQVRASLSRNNSSIEEKHVYNYQMITIEDYYPRSIQYQ